MTQSGTATATAVPAPGVSAPRPTEQQPHPALILSLFSLHQVQCSETDTISAVFLVNHFPHDVLVPEMYLSVVSQHR